MNSASRKRPCSSVLHRSRGLVMVYGFLAFFPPGVPPMVNLDLVDAILPTQTEEDI
jgi:hypothetical protein